MPHAYCTSCEATLTVFDGHCLAGHPVATTVENSGRGRHRAPSRRQQRRSATKLHTPTTAPSEPGGPTGPESRDPSPPPSPPLPTASPPRPPAGLPEVRVETRPPPSPAWQAPIPSARRVYNSSLMEMLGLGEPELDFGEDTHTAAITPAPQWQAPAPPPPPPRSGLDMLPGLADMHTNAEDNTDTGTLIERLWVATAEHEAVQPAESFESEEPKDLPARTFRWSVIALALLLVVAAGVLIRISADLPARYAVEASERYRSAIGSVQAVLPDTRSLLDSITDPAVPVEELSDAAVVLSRFDTASRDLFAAASEKLPSTPPLVARDDLDALTPLRQGMASASEAGLGIERRIGDALTYRLVFAKAFQIPALPLTASPEEASNLGVELGLNLAETLDALAQLPTDPRFATHRQRADQLADRYAEWQIEYLSALRTVDLDGSARLITELEGAVADLQRGIAVPLGALHESGVEELDRLAGDLERLAQRLS